MSEPVNGFMIGIDRQNATDIQVVQVVRYLKGGIHEVVDTFYGDTAEQMYKFMTEQPIAFRQMINSSYGLTGPVCTLEEANAVCSNKEIKGFKYLRVGKEERNEKNNSDL